MPVDGAQTEFEISVLPSLEPVVAELTSGRMACAAIDIPIGLAGREPRTCDVAARRVLGPRRSSIFPAPVRAVLEAASYAEACVLSRRACGKGISKQLYNIVDKIRTVDALQSPRLQDQLFEMGPELSFAELTGRPMPANKRTAEGRAAREEALASADAFGESVRGILDACRRRPERSGTTCSTHSSVPGRLAAMPPASTGSSAATSTHGACAWRSSPDRRIACPPDDDNGRGRLDIVQWFGTLVK